MPKLFENLTAGKIIIGLLIFVIILIFLAVFVTQVIFFLLLIVTLIIGHEVLHLWRDD